MSKYASATVTMIHPDGFQTVVVDLEGKAEAGLAAAFWEAWPWQGSDDGDEDEPDQDELPDGVKFSDPEGFAVHLFKMSDEGYGEKRGTPVRDFDDLLEAWSNEDDDDRREAMGEYMDDMGADDLSDFDEAYQGQYTSGADFAQRFSEETGSVPDNIPSWIAIDWEQTWNGGLRFDYHITDSGHVFRNM